MVAKVMIARQYAWHIPDDEGLAAERRYDVGGGGRDAVAEHKAGRHGLGEPQAIEGAIPGVAKGGGDLHGDARLVGGEQVAGQRGVVGLAGLGVQAAPLRRGPQQGVYYLRRVVARAAGVPVDEHDAPVSHLRHADGDRAGRGGPRKGGDH